MSKQLREDHVTWTRRQDLFSLIFVCYLGTQLDLFLFSSLTHLSYPF